MISEYKKRKLRQKFLCDKSLLRKKTDLISEENPKKFTKQYTKCFYEFHL